MSVPLSACLISKAGMGDEQAIKQLVSAMAVNEKYGSFSVFPCACNPPCPQLTQEQATKLNNLVKAALKAKEG